MSTIGGTSRSSIVLVLDLLLFAGQGESLEEARYHKLALIEARPLRYNRSGQRRRLQSRQFLFRTPWFFANLTGGGG